MSRTVKVRIAVAVDPAGNWNAIGGSWAKGDEDTMGLCVDMLSEGEARYWVETEVALPTSAEPIVVTATDVTP